MRLPSIALALSLVLASPAFAQDQASLDRMVAAQAAAEAGASRPGDEALDCAQLEAELGATMNDPVLQAQIAEMGAWGQGQMDQMQAGQGQRARSTGMQAQAQANMADMMVQAQRMESIMPQIMRGQRIVELGQAKQCAFAQETQQPAQ